jgi:hypothetical protein
MDAPNCYKCKHRGTIPWDAHSECKNPKISECDKILSLFAIMRGQKSGSMKRLNISGNETGISRGWFNWPINYDPAWLLTCDGFEKGGTNEAEKT